MHTRERWLKHRRLVVEGQEPVKVVRGMYNDPQRPAELYGFWQTRFYRQQLTADGTIPRNKYGNIELFNGPLPEGTLWLGAPKVFAACR